MNETLKSFVSDICPCCLEKKDRGKSFCSGCYHQLPKAMKGKLFKRFGLGYEEAYAEAEAYLGVGEERETTKRVADFSKETEIFEQAERRLLLNLKQRFSNSVALAKVEYTWGWCYHEKSCFLYGIIQLPGDNYDKLVRESSAACNSDLCFLKNPTMTPEEILAIVKDSIKRRAAESCDEQEENQVLD